MALSTYTELQASVASWLNRADLTTPIVDFITLCHKDLMRSLRGHPRMIKRNEAFTIDSEYEAVPADFIELHSAYMNTSPKRALEYLTGDDQSKMYGLSSGDVKYIAVTGNTTAGTEMFRFAPPPSASGTATLEYSASITFFASGAATNWILTDYPKAYLYGSLYYAYVYLQAQPSAQPMYDLYRNEIAEIKQAGNKTRWGANGMMVRPA